MKSPNSSPCIKQCKLDDTKKYCLGCLRTLEEIAEAGRKAKDERPAARLLPVRNI